MDCAKPGDPDRATLAPGFPASLAASGKEYALERLPWRGHFLSLRFRFLDSSRIQVSVPSTGPLAVREVYNQQGQALPMHRQGFTAEVELVNFGLYTLAFSASPAR